MTKFVLPTRNRELIFSTIFLLISNIIAVILFNTQHWDFFTIFWLFFFQFLLIGFFKLILIQISVGNLFTKFAICYFFSAFYLLFIFILITSLWLNPPKVDAFNWILLIVSFFVFFVSHAISFHYDRKQVYSLDEVTKRHLILRVAPIYILLIFASNIDSSNQIAINTFLFIKILVDVGTHFFENVGEPKYETVDDELRKKRESERKTLVILSLSVICFWILAIGGILSLRYSLVCLPSVLLFVLVLVICIIYAMTKNI